MIAPTFGTQPYPFTPEAPPIHITPSKCRPFRVDCCEVLSLFVVPQVGHMSMFGSYFWNSARGEWLLAEVCRMRATRPARIHGVSCVEIAQDRWTPEAGWRLDIDDRCYYRVTPTGVQWIAQFHTGCEDDPDPGSLVLHTFEDERSEGQLLAQRPFRPPACYLYRLNEEDVDPVISRSELEDRLVTRPDLLLDVLDHDRPLSVHEGNAAHGEIGGPVLDL